MRYHEGELQAQALAGVTDPHSPFSRFVQATVSEKAQARIAAADLAVVATIDETGQPWAWPLAGSPGFLRVSATAVELDAALVAATPMGEHLQHSAACGLVSMSLERRLRARVNGAATVQGDGLTIAVAEAFTNCPKYITARKGAPAPSRVSYSGVSTGGLTPEALELIANADTFFIASRSAAGMLDASHRGGSAGFVETGQGPLRFADYAGNNMFQSMGNVLQDPRVGLLFVDFAQGRWLQVAARADVEFAAREPEGIVTAREVRCRPTSSAWGTGIDRRWRLAADG